MARYDTGWQGRTKRRRAAQVRWLRVLAVPGGIVGFFALAWVVLHSPLLRVKRVVVADVSRVEAGAVLDAARASRTTFARRALTPAHLLGWPGELDAAAVALVPGAESVDVRRNFITGTVTLAVREREPVGIWCFEGDPAASVCQWFDDEGVVYSRTTPGAGSLIPVAHDLDQARAGEGRRVLPPEQVGNFLAVLAILRERGIAPRELQVHSGVRGEVAMTTYSGPRLIFGLRLPPDHVPPILDDFIKRGALASLSYVDFRSPKRAFYQ